ncbi:MAG: hypothetical protein JXA99_15990 [Candidatus Lokiarchaeota archaeon]|nr:hypothetical protein [Candidatus Lokiarchaeota archaeon]
MIYQHGDGWEWFTYYWDEFITWFLAAPLIAQILVIIGIATVLILTIVLVYYIAKGVCLLLTYIGKGIYKLFKGLSTAVEGKSKKNEESEEIHYVQVIENRAPVQSVPQKVNINTNTYNKASFCPECGIRFSGKVLNALESRGFAFCQQCGSKTESNSVQISI